MSYMIKRVNELNDLGLTAIEIAEEVGLTVKRVKTILTNSENSSLYSNDDYNHGGFYESDVLDINDVKNEILTEAGYYNNNY